MISENHGLLRNLPNTINDPAVRAVPLVHNPIGHLQLQIQVSEYIIIENPRLLDPVRCLRSFTHLDHLSSEEIRKSSEEGGGETYRAHGPFPSPYAYLPITIPPCSCSMVLGPFS